MDFRISKKLDFKLTKVIHVGAHKFEEATDYSRYGTSDVFWIDPFPQLDPRVLPPNHKFLRIAIDDVPKKSFRDFTIYEATGFSSFYELDSPGSLMRGTPNKPQRVRVEIDSLRNIQKIHHLSKFETIVIDTQGSEYEILKSTNLLHVREIVVETSRNPLYTNEINHSEVHKFLLSKGFHHNFNDSDLIFGHGDQYYSRTKLPKKTFEILRRVAQTLRFLASCIARVKTAILLRISKLTLSTE
jgi:hypothetical protein